MTYDEGSEITAEFEAAAATVRDARRFVVSALDHLGAVDGTGDAALLTSELATNAVIHARSRYRVTVVRLPGRIRVLVADGNAAEAHRRHYSPMSGTGRGLGLVADLAVAWGMESTGDGKIVWFEVPAVEGSAAAAGRAAVAADASARADVEADLDSLLADLGGWDDDPAPPAAPPGGGDAPPAPDARARTLVLAGTAR